MHISPTKAQALMVSRVCGEDVVVGGGLMWEFWRRIAVARQTLMEALLPSPAPIGIVERMVYAQPGIVERPRERRR